MANQNSPEKIVLTGYIYRDPEGMFISHCIELDIDTWAETLEKVRAITPSMIQSYFAAAKKLGTYQQVVAQLAKNRGKNAAAAVAERWQASRAGRGLKFTAQFKSAA